MDGANPPNVNCPTENYELVSQVNTEEIKVDKDVDVEVSAENDKPFISSNECTELKESLPIQQGPIFPNCNVDVYLLSQEMRHAFRVFRELLGDQYRSITWPFIFPVNAKELGLWDYHERITEPMSFAKIQEKFNDGCYETITAVVADLRLMLENCYRYNGVDHVVAKQGQKIEQVLAQKLNLLPRSLKDKTTLAATNLFRNKGYLNEGTDCGQRRRPTRVAATETSLTQQLKIERELEEKERKRQKELERKVANEALHNELMEWEEKMLTHDVMKTITSEWEVPSLGLLLISLKDQLGLNEFNFTEFELALLFPTKSSLLCRIFTALLLTPSQRQRLAKKGPMNHIQWSTKLKSRVTSWYKLAEKEGCEASAIFHGFNPWFFNKTGCINPLLHSGFNELELPKRLCIMIALCESCLDLDTELRDELNRMSSDNCQDLYLGQDDDGYTYHYFPQFGATDIRIYRQLEQPLSVPVDRPKIFTPGFIAELSSPASVSSVDSEDASGKKESVSGDVQSTMKSTRTTAERRSSNRKQQKKREIEDVPESSFELIAWDVASLGELCGHFQSKQKKKRTPKKKQSAREVEMSQTLNALYDELLPREPIFQKSSQKAKVKIMQEYESVQDHPITNEKDLNDISDAMETPSPTGCQAEPTPTDAKQSTTSMSTAEDQSTVAMSQCDASLLDRGDDSISVPSDTISELPQQQVCDKVKREKKSIRERRYLQREKQRILAEKVRLKELLRQQKEAAKEEATNRAKKKKLEDVSQNGLHSLRQDVNQAKAKPSATVTSITSNTIVSQPNQSLSKNSSVVDQMRSIPAPRLKYLQTSDSKSPAAIQQQNGVVLPLSAMPHGLLPSNGTPLVVSHIPGTNGQRLCFVTLPDKTTINGGRKVVAVQLNANVVPKPPEMTTTTSMTPKTQTVVIPSTVLRPMSTPSVAKPITTHIQMHPSSLSNKECSSETTFTTSVSNNKQHIEPVNNPETTTSSTIALPPSASTVNSNTVVHSSTLPSNQSLSVQVSSSEQCDEGKSFSSATQFRTNNIIT